MTVHLSLIAGCSIVFCIFSQETAQSSSLFKCSLSSIIALRHILNELATETDCDNGPSSVPNPFFQLSTVIDSHFGNIKTMTTDHIKFNYAHDTGLALLTSVLIKTVPHELWDTIQQHRGSIPYDDISYKETVKNTVYTLFDRLNPDKSLNLLPAKAGLSATLC